MSILTVDEAVNAIRQGQIIAYPTEAVYGLGCDPFNQKAVKNLLALKGRPMEKGMILIASSIEQCLPYIEIENTPWEQRVKQDWPGAVTWVLPVKEKLPVWITGGRNSLAVRVTDHPVSKSLCEQFGKPLVSTSANPTGAEPAKTQQQLTRYFDQNINGIVAGELGGLDKPTPIWMAPQMVRIR